MKLIKVVTHNGMFHADDVLACAVLALKFKGHGIEITRKRVATNEIVDADFVVDTGGRYDGNKYFDHHQSSFTKTHNSGVPKSAFGLIWGVYGLDVTTEVLIRINPSIHWTLAELRDVYQRMQGFVESQDAQDNGKVTAQPSKFSDDHSVAFDLVAFHNVISIMNASVLEEATEEGQMKQFLNAVELGKMVLGRYIIRKASRVYSYNQVRSNINPDTEVLVLPAFLEWKTAVAESPQVKFVVHPGMTPGSYVVNAARSDKDVRSPANLRAQFPASWAGLQGEELAKVTGIPSAQFCHKGRHLATATTQIGALALAVAAQKLSNK